MKAWPPIVAAERRPIDMAVRTAEARMGEMLWSAVHRGALLDRRWWPSWIAGVQREVDFRRGQLSVEMRPGDGTPQQPRRWFADPATRLLIAEWHRDRMTLPPSVTAEQCLTAHMSQNTEHGDALAVRVIAEARELWTFRLPGVLIAYAAGEVPSVSVPKPTWRRITRRLAIPDDPKPPRRATGAPSSVKTAADVLSGEKRILSAHRSPRGVKGRADVRALKVSAIGGLEALPRAATALHRLLRAWCLHALRHGNGRGTPGYAPSTVSKYLAHLEWVFTGWADRDPTTAALHDLVELFVSHLEDASASDLNPTVNAMLSFAAYRASAGSDEDDVLDLDLAAYRSEQPVSADLVPPSAYERALDALVRSGDEELALILTLGFRAGARLEEIMALRVGDFAEGRGRFELVIQENEARLLKTKTSRRIVPLDVLLESEERDRLDHWLARRREVARLVGDTWMFGAVAASTPPSSGLARKRVEAVLQRACGSERVCFAHLRHSFASYLLATLLLPQDVEEPPIPDELRPVVSHVRRERVMDRLLGQGRLGGGAVHAVSQLMGHTGPAMTLRSYCHLLDLCLGLYVGRPSTLPPVDDAWLREKLDTGPDARRKIVARHGAPSQHAESGTGPGRPTVAQMKRTTPFFSRKVGDARLLSTRADKVGRRVQGAQAAKVESVALGAPFRRCEPSERSEQHRSTRPHAPAPHGSSGYIVPWALMASVLDGGCVPNARTGVDAARAERWIRDARRFGADSILGRGEARGYATAAPTERTLRQLLDRRLTLARELRRPEKNALRAAIWSLRNHAGELRLKRLADGCAFVRLLRLMGFTEDEIILSVTGLASKLPSKRLHRFLQDRSEVVYLRGRGGWRCSLVIRLRPREADGPRVGAAACRFALMMLAIDSDLFTSAR